MNTTAVLLIAKQEFSRTLTNPFVLLVGGILLVIAYLNGAGDYQALESFTISGNIDGVLQGFGQCWHSTSLICTIMAAFIGATSISYDRWNNSLNILLSKPLYRKDYIVGKLMGLITFMLLFITFIILFIGLMIIVFYRPPLSVSDFLLRVGAYIFVMTLSCSLVIVLNIFFSVISKNLLFVVAASLTYIYFDWIWYNNEVLGDLSLFTPMKLYNKLINPIPTTYPTLYNTLIPFAQWLSSATPYIGIMVIEILILILAGIGLFTRDENT